MKAKTLVAIISGLLFFSLIPHPHTDIAHAQFGLKEAITNTDLDTNLKKKHKVAAWIGKAVGAGLSLIGITFFGLILYAGVLWMTARGDATVATKSKDILSHAFIGLGIVMAGFVITDFAMTAIAGKSSASSEEAEDGITFTFSDEETVDDLDDTQEVSDDAAHAALVRDCEAFCRNGRDANAAAECIQDRCDIL